MILSAQTWTKRQAAHEAAADELTADHLRRRTRHEKHPVYDFLFEYYPVRPSHLRRWHPGGLTRLDDPDGRAPHRQWKDYRVLGDEVLFDAEAYRARRGSTIDYIRNLLVNTSAHPARFDCFGLHEWAMVYRADRLRHDLPLRLGARETDRVVEKHHLRCSHYDAFRFFTPPARPLNLRVLERADQPATEQAGCVHATMDLYKWAAKLGPAVPGELFLETFRLARDARVLDMEASPYDCRGLGFGVVAIETAEGKAEYVERQRALSTRAKRLRARLVGVIDDTFGG